MIDARARYRAAARRLRNAALNVVYIKYNTAFRITFTCVEMAGDS